MGNKTFTQNSKYGKILNWYRTLMIQVLLSVTFLIISNIADVFFDS